MKKGILLIIIFSIFGFWACETEESERAVIKATISGEPWFSYEPHAILSDSMFTLSALSTDGVSIEFSVSGGFIGGYNLEDTIKNKAKLTPNRSKYANRYRSNGKSPSGIVRITNIDEKNMEISGTFFFKAWHPTDPIYEYVSDGVFRNVPFSYISFE